MDTPGFASGVVTTFTWNSPLDCGAKHSSNAGLDGNATWSLHLDAMFLGPQQEIANVQRHFRRLAGLDKNPVRLGATR